MSTQDIFVVAIVAVVAVGFLAYVFGELDGRIRESRRKVRQEVTATYHTFYSRDGKPQGYVKVYKSSVLLGDDE